MFKGPKLKVQRAKEHISDLNREILKFGRKDPYKVVVDKDSEPGFDLLRIVQRIPDPESWPLILGDAIHNLRSALDILACDVMRLHGRGISSVHFPFCKRAEDFEDVLKERTIHRARPEIVALFRKLQPYRGGNDLLRSVHDLDISDKHKLLIPALVFPGVRDLEILRADGSTFLGQMGRGGIILTGHESKILFRIPTADRAKFKYDGKSPFQVTFGKGPLHGNTVLPSLAQMAKLVDEIVAVFEDHLTRPRPVIYLGFSN